jgi:hypothetical protein
MEIRKVGKQTQKEHTGLVNNSLSEPFLFVKCLKSIVNRETGGREESLRKILEKKSNISFIDSFSVASDE